MRRPRRIFRSTLPRPARRLGFPVRGFSVRPLHAGIAAIGLTFLGLAALVMAGTLFPGGTRGNPARIGAAGAEAGPAFPGDRAGADRLEATGSDIAVVDGSTLRLAHKVVRLLGIDTPRRGQACPQAAGGPFPLSPTDSATGGATGSATGIDCGAASTAALAALVRQHRVACEVRDSDSLGRPLAICAAGGVELNHALVAGGWARVGGEAGLARAQVQDLRNAETLARAEHRGLWAANFGAANSEVMGPGRFGEAARHATW